MDTSDCDVVVVTDDGAVIVEVAHTMHSEGCWRRRIEARGVSGVQRVDGGILVFEVQIRELTPSRRVGDEVGAAIEDGHSWAKLLERRSVLAAKVRRVQDPVHVEEDVVLGYRLQARCLLETLHSLVCDCVFRCAGREHGAFVGVIDVHPTWVDAYAIDKDVKAWRSLDHEGAEGRLPSFAFDADGEIRFCVRGGSSWKDRGKLAQCAVEPWMKVHMLERERSVRCRNQEVVNGAVSLAVGYADVVVASPTKLGCVPGDVLLHEVASVLGRPR